jgi:hypothetical protein
MNYSLTKSAVLVASPDQISADLAPDQSGQAVILGLKDGVYFELNEVGARIWQLIQQPRSLQSVLDTLLMEYDVSPAQCEADIMKLTQEMLRRGLVEVRDGPAA